MTGQMNSQNNEPPIDHGSHWMATLFASWLNPREIAMWSKNSDWPRWVVGRAALTIFLMSMISVVVRTSCGCFLNLSIAGPLGIVGIYQLVNHRLMSIAILLTAWILLGLVLSCVISMMSGGMRSWLQIFACVLLAIAASSPCLCIPIIGDEVMAVVGGILGCRLVWYTVDNSAARLTAVVSSMLILGVLLLLPNISTSP